MTLRREWANNDRIELDLPMTTRLEPVDPRQPQTVALLFGPLVLFPLTEKRVTLPHADLLGANRMDKRSWQVKTNSSTIRLLPFIQINDEQYSTYVEVT